MPRRGGCVGLVPGAGYPVGLVRVPRTGYRWSENLPKLPAAAEIGSFRSV